MLEHIGKVASVKGVLIGKQSFSPVLLLHIHEVGEPCYTSVGLADRRSLYLKVKTWEAASSYSGRLQYKPIKQIAGFERNKAASKDTFDSQNLTAKLRRVRYFQAINRLIERRRQREPRQFYPGTGEGLGGNANYEMAAIHCHNGT